VSAAPSGHAACLYSLDFIPFFLVRRYDLHVYVMFHFYTDYLHEYRYKSAKLVCSLRGALRLMV